MTKETVRDKVDVKVEPTNKEYSKREDFITLCAAADVEATPRQASKFRNKQGKLYDSLHKGRKIILSDNS